MSQYIWKNGGFHIKAQVAGERLAQLAADNNNRLTPRMVVDDARPVESPLHPCFEWDDLRAAECYREDQARQVIRSIRIAQNNTGGDARVMRAYVNIVEQVGQDAQHAYMSLAAVLADDVLRQQLLIKARADLIAFKQRYSEFAELASVADDALEQIDLLAAETTAA